ncbi:MAG: DNA-3-methyladenine glycosylase I [Candidatus Limnocylindrales bacterium]
MPETTRPRRIDPSIELVRCSWALGDPLLRAYHDTEWGVPVRDEGGVYERITLEGFQAGLSWLTILRKRPAFRLAFDDFDPEAVARFRDDDLLRLMGDPGIVRNRAKIEAARTNARATIALRDHGGLPAFVWSFAPESSRDPVSATVSDESIALSKALRKRGFAFVGPTTMYALMEAIGLFDPHVIGCHRRGVA